MLGVLHEPFDLFDCRQDDRYESCWNSSLVLNKSSKWMRVPPTSYSSYMHMHYSSVPEKKHTPQSFYPGHLLYSHILSIDCSFLVERRGEGTSFWLLSFRSRCIAPTWLSAALSPPSSQVALHLGQGEGAVFNLSFIKLQLARVIWLASKTLSDPDPPCSTGCMFLMGGHSVRGALPTR